MTLSEAVFSRTSCRDFLSQPISPVQRRQLEKAIHQCSRRTGVHIRLICDHSEPFSTFFKSFGRIKGASNYLLFAGPADDPDLEEKCGYCGEEVVLTAQTMGLDTCWVGGTYDKEICLRHLDEGDELICIAAIGHPVPGKKKQRPLKPLEKLSSGSEEAPQWFLDGMAAVQRAPSAMNRQGYCFTYRKDGTVRVRLSGTGSFALVDLGIAKQHFALGAHGGEWTWGDGGIFRKAAEEKSCGAVIWRPSGNGGREYLLVRHNGGHWSFPKGHVESGETETETAAREILEETGLTVEIHTGFRKQVTYSPKPGVIKDVIFFTAVPTDGQEHPQESEISQLGWFPFPEAARQVTYATDEEILLAAEDFLNRQ